MSSWPVASFPCITERLTAEQVVSSEQTNKRTRERATGHKTKPASVTVMEVTFRQATFLQVTKACSPEDREQRDERPAAGTAGDTEAVGSGMLHFKARGRDIMPSPQNASGSDLLEKARCAGKRCNRGVPTARV